MLETAVGTEKVETRSADSTSPVASTGGNNYRSKAMPLGTQVVDCPVFKKNHSKQTLLFLFFVFPPHAARFHMALPTLVRWRNSQVRGFHFPASISEENDPHRSTAPVKSGDGDGEKGAPWRDDRRRPPPVLGPPPPPVVSPSPSFTRDMQVWVRVIALSRLCAAGREGGGRVWWVGLGRVV